MFWLLKLQSDLKAGFIEGSIIWVLSMARPVQGSPVRFHGVFHVLEAIPVLHFWASDFNTIIVSKEKEMNWSTKKIIDKMLIKIRGQKNYCSSRYFFLNIFRGYLLLGPLGLLFELVETKWHTKQCSEKCRDSKLGMRFEA